MRESVRERERERERESDRSENGAHERAAHTNAYPTHKPYLPEPAAGVIFIPMQIGRNDA